MIDEIQFNKKSHSYSENGIPFKGVTEWVQSFVPEKDWVAIATKKAKKLKKPVEEILKEWEYENNKGITRGNSYHKKREEEILAISAINNLPIIPSIFSEDEKQNIVKVAPNQKLSEGVYPELFLVLRSKRICGQADLVEVTKDGIFNVYDYKTTKSLKKEGYTNWEGVVSCLLSPFNSIPDTNFWVNTIQINMYAHIIKKNNPSFKLGKMCIIQPIFNEKDEVTEVINHEVPNIMPLIKIALK
jgi:hypothetical protein